jgi:hypothetical protein
LFRLRHTITRHQFTVEVTRINIREGSFPQRKQGRWLRLTELRGWPLSGLHRKIVACLEHSKNPGV